MTEKLTDRAKEVLDYAQEADWFTTRDLLLDIDINSGSATRRITELRDAGYVFDEEWRRHPVTDRRYKAWRLNMDLSGTPIRTSYFSGVDLGDGRFLIN